MGVKKRMVGLRGLGAHVEGIPWSFSAWDSCAPRYDVEWKDINLVGDAEEAAKNTMDGPLVVVCNEGSWEVGEVGGTRYQGDDLHPLMQQNDGWH